MKGYLEARSLTIGDSLSLYNTSLSVIVGLSQIDTLITVYNFEVEDFHTYFVGNTHIWTHNNGCLETLKAFAFDISKATDSELAALDHAFKRHGSELSELVNKPIKWTKKTELQGMLDNFNEAVSLIQKNGELVGQKNVPFAVKGSGESSQSTLVDICKYTHTDGKKYYLYRRAYY